MLYHEKTKLEHVFAILRFDAGMAAEFGMKTDYITVKKIVRSEDQAIVEVDRLNRLNGDKGAVYFWRSSRLSRDPRMESDLSSGEIATAENVSSTRTEA